jgi:hypothetical protein
MKRIVLAFGLAALFGCAAQAQRSTNQPTNRRQTLPDAVEEAQTPRAVEQRRIEQNKTGHDDPKSFAATNAQPSSPIFKNQPDEGRILGFECYRDPLNAKTPMQSPDDIRKMDEEAKPQVMADQRKLLESRYNL